MIKNSHFFPRTVVTLEDDRQNLEAAKSWKRQADDLHPKHRPSEGALSLLSAAPPRWACRPVLRWRFMGGWECAAPMAHILESAAPLSTGAKCLWREKGETASGDSRLWSVGTIADSPLMRGGGVGKGGPGGMRWSLLFFFFFWITLLLLVSVVVVVVVVQQQLLLVEPRGLIFTWWGCWRFMFLT